MAGASEQLLQLLHDAVARDLLERIKGTPVYGEDGKVTGYVKASAADISNALKMLKDNNITSVADENNALGALAAQLAGAPTVGEATQTDLDAALEQLNWSEARA